MLDEPTTGLHFEDIRKLLNVLSRLVDQGNSVLVIEHNLDVIKTADWLIDLGPEGGNKGGLVVAEGTPEDVVQVPASYTGQFLGPVLQGRAVAVAALDRTLAADPDGRAASNGRAVPASSRPVPAKQTAAKKTAAKKAAARKTTAQSSTAKKTPAKNTLAKKAAGKRTAAKKTTAKKVVRSGG